MRALAAAASLSLTASLAGAADGDPVEVWLREGAAMSVSATPAGDRIVFGLVGRAWNLNLADGFAAQLSEDDEYAGRPVVSPDGKLIAYETVRDGHYHIIVRNSDGSLPRQVTFGSVNHRSPSWSRSHPGRPFDGHRLIMSSDRGGRYGVWEIDVDSLDLRQLTFASHDEREPAWNEDGTRIAYVTDTPTGTALYAVIPGGQPEQLLREDARMRAPAWRPGGGLLTYVRQLNGESQLRMLLLSEPAITKPISHGEDVFPYPAVWFDSSRFLYTGDGVIRQRLFGERTAETIVFNARIEIPQDQWHGKSLPVGLADNQPVTGNNGRTVTTDGRSIVATLGDLWELRPNGSLLRQLTNDPYVDASPAWSPDSQSVAYVSDRGGSLQVWLMDLESMQSRRLTRERGVALEPRWSEDGTSIEYLSAAHPAATKFDRRRVAVASGRTESVDAEPAVAADPPIAAPLPFTWRPVVGSGRKIIRTSRLFDGLGPGYQAEREIVIENDRIVAVRPWSSPEALESETAEIVDATDRTIIPGLIDMSVRQARIGDERLGRKFLAYGVTTIRESVTRPDEAAERRESWASGRRIGPRLLTTSTPCSSDPGSFVVRPVLEPAVAQREFRGRINDAVKRGSVSIGVCQSLNVSTRLDLIATVHALGVPAMTVSAFPDILLGANETRPPAPELAGYADFPTVTGKLGTTVTSNLALTGLPLLIARGELLGGWQFRELFTGAERDWYARDWNPTEERQTERRIRTRAVGKSIAAAVARGARVVTGSDAALVPPGLSLHAELRLLTDTGLQPFQVLRMATRDAARALGAADVLGVIRPGAVADLVIVDGDPLRDIRDADNVTATISAGRIFSRSELSSAGHRPATVGNLYNPQRVSGHKPLISTGNAAASRHAGGRQTVAGSQGGE